MGWGDIWKVWYASENYKADALPVGGSGSLYGDLRDLRRISECVYLFADVGRGGGVYLCVAPRVDVYVHPAGKPVYHGVGGGEAKLVHDERPQLEIFRFALELPGLDAACGADDGDRYVLADAVYGNDDG